MKLRYNYLGQVLSVDIGNDYTVTAMYISTEQNKYNVTLYLSMKSVDYLLGMGDTITLETTKETICMAIVDKIRELYDNGQIPYYISEYDYIMNCIDTGDDVLNGKIVTEE